jgi:hypothetical protein
MAPSKIRLHDSQHTTLSLLEKAGGPISVVSKWAGHYSPTNKALTSRYAGQGLVRRCLKRARSEVRSAGLERLTF